MTAQNSSVGDDSGVSQTFDLVVVDHYAAIDSSLEIKNLIIG